MSDDALVFDATTESFDRDVVQRSREIPILVDFWAQWCGPCRSLAPVLDRIVDSYGGKMLLAKVDTEAEPDLAAKHGIRSLPTVRLYRDAQVVTEFMGAQPESQIRALLEPHLPRESDAVAAEGLALAQAGRLDDAQALLAAAHAQDPANEELGQTLVEVTVAAGQLEAARGLIKALPAAQRHADWVHGVEARLLFAEVAQDSEPSEALQARLRANPSDLQARYQLGAKFAMSGDIEAAMDELLTLMKASRKFEDDAGRKGLLAIFELLGDRHPLVGKYRQQMASALY